MKTTQFQVTLNLPENCSVKDMQKYVHNSIISDIGLLSPKDPLFNLDRKSVKVKHVQDKPVGAYLIEGSSGSYEDVFHWIVKGFTSKEKAQDLLDNLNKFLEENNLNKHMSWEDYESKEELVNPYDDHFRVNIDGTHYQIVSIDFEINKGNS